MRLNSTISPSSDRGDDDDDDDDEEGEEEEEEEEVEEDEEEGLRVSGFLQTGQGTIPRRALT